MTSWVFRLLAGAVVVVTTSAPVPLRAQSSPSPLRLLDVPYVPQSVELCGGAAAAMVMRYWGETGVYAETFEHLVDRAAGGIRGADLIQALAERGWQAVSFAGDPARVQRALDERRPPIVLIEDRPGRFHYVVVVGWHQDRVVFHDPARAPFRIVGTAPFVRAWAASGFWTMLTLPARGERFVPGPAGTTTGASPADGPCGQMVEEGVRLARSGDPDEAHDLLHLASLQCPRDGAPWRELAGLHAVRQDWSLAADAARKAVELDRRDAHAVRVLATSLFVEGDAIGALDAWNLIDEPRVDLVEVHGLARIRYGVADGALGLQRQDVLTTSVLRQASRRLTAVPSIRAARVSYVPIGDGHARVSAAVVERPLLAAGRAAAAATALRAVAEREARIEIGSPTGSGELWYAAWRWWDSRPRVALGLAAPSPFGGLWRVDAADERQTYQNAAGLLVERHRRVGLGFSDWMAGGLWWQADLSFEAWPGGQRSVGVGGRLTRHLNRDRVTVSARAARWAGGAATWQTAAAMRWRSRTAETGSIWLVDMGGEMVGDTAPLALWPGAGTGHGRGALLRAHPLVHAGVIRDGVFGRRLGHATVEWQRWSAAFGGLARIAPAVFVDSARAWHVDTIGDGRAHVDAGAGIRVLLPGAGVLRLDLARGLRDGRSAFSMALSTR